MRTTKSIFITFGAGSKNYIDAGKRLINQAKSTGYFDKTILYTDEYLRKDTQFWSSHSEFISNNKRGYGYWIWKSYIIKKTFETMNDGDILMYLDCGCEIGGEKELLIPTFFDYVKKDKIIGSFTCIEKNWNKMDLLIYLNMQNSELINKSQHQAGALLFYICKETRELVDKWYNIGCNYHMIDDSPSIEKNLECFEEHRHDQSIFSLLYKKYNLRPFKDPSQLGKYPIGYLEDLNDTDIIIKKELRSLSNGRKYRINSYIERYPMVLYLNKKKHPLVSLAKYYIKVLLYKFKLYKGAPR